MPLAVETEQLGQMFDFKGILGNHATVGGAGHGRQKRRITGIATEDFQHQKTLVRTGAGAQVVGQLDGTSNTGGKPDAVVGARHVVVHRLRDSDDFDTLLMQPQPVAEGVVSTDRDQGVDTEKIKILKHCLGDIIDILGVSVAQV